MARDDVARDARIGMLLVTLGILLALSGALLLRRPIGFALLALPTLAAFAVLARVRAIRS